MVRKSQSNARLPWHEPLAPAKPPPGLLLCRCLKFGRESGEQFYSLLIPSRCSSTTSAPPFLIPEIPYSPQPHRGLGDLGANSRIDSLGPDQLCAGQSPYWGTGSPPQGPHGAWSTGLSPQATCVGQPRHPRVAAAPGLSQPLAHRWLHPALLQQRELGRLSPPGHLATYVSF